jgi:hypothetical protein
MIGSKKTITTVSITLIFALGLGVVIGLSIKSGFQFSRSANQHNNAVPLENINWEDKSAEELSTKLSEMMLPEDEFLKLEAAIFQTAMGLFMAQSQAAGINVTDTSQQELKKSIDDKYSRKYFSDMNASSMKELSKPELVSVLMFYNTEAGQKFLKLSPKVIQTTMKLVQEDLSSWLPKTVDALVTKLKDGNKEDKRENKENELNKEGLENNSNGQGK